MRRAAITGGTIALYLNRDDPQDSAAADDEDAMVDENTDESAADGDADAESSKDDGKSTEDSPDSARGEGAGDGDNDAGEENGNGWLSDRLDALRNWLTELVNT